MKHQTHVRRELTPGWHSIEYRVTCLHPGCKYVEKAATQDEATRRGKHHEKYPYKYKGN